MSDQDGDHQPHADPEMDGRLLYMQHLRRQRDQALAERDQALEQAAEYLAEAAQLHRQIDSLGTSPDKLARMVGAGMAVQLYGRTYVDRKAAALWAMDGYPPMPTAEPTVQVTNTASSDLLLEAAGGVFVPIPAGHMLTVTVAPYDPTPEGDGPADCAGRD